MKKITLISAAIIAYCMLHTAYCFSQGTAINITGAAADSSAMLDVSSTSKGALIPRMTEDERNAIVSPAIGLQIYNTTSNCFNFWTGSTWRQICGDCDFNSPIASNNSPICEGSTLNLTATTILGATYSWTGPNGFTSNQQNPVIPNATAAASGPYSVTASKNGCTCQPQSTVATVNAIPQTPTAGSNSPLWCSNTLNLTATTITGASYTWSGPNSFTAYTQNPTRANIQIADTGTYSVFATVAGCSSALGYTDVDVLVPVSSFSNSQALTSLPVSFTSTPTAGATYDWVFTGGTPGTSTDENPVVTWNTSGSYNVSLTVTKSGCASVTNNTVNVSNAMSCLAIKQAVPSAADGVYIIDPDGGGSYGATQCYCDMTTDGGGWTLVLNYLHRGGTNPTLTIKTTTLPLLGSTSLGTDESGSATTWGHASNSLMNAISFTEVRFYAKTSGNPRIINFKTSYSNAISYFKTGTGNCTGLGSNYTALSGHTATIPSGTDGFFSNEGDYAMTNFPYYIGGSRHWGIRGLGNRWEVDDYPDNEQYDTFHQIWVK